MISTIQHLFNQAIIIKRLKPTSGNKTHMIATGTADAHLRRIDLQSDANAFQVYGATHKAYVDISVDIKEGDTVVDPRGTIYSVVSVIEKEPDIAINEHKEVILRKFSS